MREGNATGRLVTPHPDFDRYLRLLSRSQLLPWNGIVSVQPITGPSVRTGMNIALLPGSLWSAGVSRILHNEELLE